jgi:hypothetical protein
MLYVGNKGITGNRVEARRGLLEINVWTDTSRKERTDMRIQDNCMLFEKRYEVHVYSNMHQFFYGIGISYS